MTAYSSCWACCALSDEDMANLPGSCKHCGREFTKPVTAPTTGVQVSQGEDGQWSITGLSEDDLWAFWRSLEFFAADRGIEREGSEEDRLLKIIDSALP